MGVLPSVFFVMALLAQSPPVIPVSEQVRITTVRNDMIDNHRFRMFLPDSSRAFQP